VILKIENKTPKTLNIYVEARSAIELLPNGRGTITFDIIDITVEENENTVQESG